MPSGAPFAMDARGSSPAGAEPFVPVPTVFYDSDGSTLEIVQAPGLTA